MGKVLDLPRIHLRGAAPDFAPASSCIYVDAAANWPELAQWTPRFFAERCDGIRQMAYVSVPDDPVPFRHAARGRTEWTVLADIVARMERGERIYGPALQTTVAQALGMDQRFLSLVPPALRRLESGRDAWACQHYVTLWVGNHTRSGLHYDTFDNLLLQVHGTKSVAVVAAEHSAALYPFGDAVSKSRVNIERPDYAAHPRFRDVPVGRATLRPGEVLFLRRGDWHYLASDGPAISINCWYGAELPISDRVRRVNSANPLLWLAILRDFFWHGLLRRSFVQRLACPKPTGQELYELLAGRRSG